MKKKNEAFQLSLLNPLKSLKNQRGSTLITVLILSVVVLGVLSSVALKWAEQLAQNKQSQRRLRVEAVGLNLDRVIRNPQVVHSSLFDADCLYNSSNGALVQVFQQGKDPEAAGNSGLKELLISERVDSKGNLVGAGCLLHMVDTEVKLDIDSPFEEDKNYYPVEITLPEVKDSSGNSEVTQAYALDEKGNSVRTIIGTRSNPVFYNQRGEICYEPGKRGCELMAFAMYRVENSVLPPSLKDVGPAIVLRYRTIRINPKYILAQDNQLDSREPGSTSKISVDVEIPVGIPPREASSIIPVVNVNGYGDPGFVKPCPDQSDRVLVGYDFSGGKKSPICKQPLAFKPCPKINGNPEIAKWLAGFDSYGNPICVGKKNVCGNGFIANGFKKGVDGPELECVRAHCVRVKGDRFTMLQPIVDQDKDDFECISIEQKSNCRNRLKTGFFKSDELNANLELDCDAS